MQLQSACAQLGDSLNAAWGAGYTANVQLKEYFSSQTEYTQNFSAQEYPRLIYDGPFSESLNHAPALADAKKVSKEQARKTAKEFTGEALTYSGYSGEAVVPFFSFAGAEGQSIAIAEQGGGVLFWNTPHATEISMLPTEQKAEEIREVGAAFLRQKGYPACELSYMQYYGGDALLNLVPLQDGVRLYSDLIKLWVQVDSMQVVRMDASAYVKNHRARTLEEKIALHDARSVLPVEAAETDYAMALIPRQTGEETYCFEFFCSYHGREAIIYVDAADGSVADILEIVHVNHGVLTR